MIDGRRAVVVDYKFGSKRRKQHTAQVAEYVSLLEAMNRFDRVEGYIWYIAENRNNRGARERRIKLPIFGLAEDTRKPA